MGAATHGERHRWANRTPAAAARRALRLGTGGSPSLIAVAVHLSIALRPLPENLRAKSQLLRAVDFLQRVPALFEIGERFREQGVERAISRLRLNRPLIGWHGVAPAV